MKLRLFRSIKPNRRIMRSYLSSPNRWIDRCNKLVNPLVTL